ncbi:MAG: hypothetical protein JRJ12_06745 [Deltaproteobacteria bacterium]|nr:hypothetical protein [Deltaproteobacteria bacterium]MBW2071094.1 hypothetical protein [Deltaproteobacteria bacterium]
MNSIDQATSLHYLHNNVVRKAFIDCLASWMFHEFLRHGGEDTLASGNGVLLGHMVQAFITGGEISHRKVPI